MGIYIGIFIYGVKHVDHKSPLLTLVSTFASNPSSRLNMPMGTGHFWFLYNLIFFYCAALFIKKISALSISKKISSFSESKIKVCALFVLPILIAPAFYNMHFPPLDMPDKFYPQLWSFGYYGIYFAAGWILFTNKLLIDVVSQHWKLLIAIASAGFIYVYQCYPETTTLAAIIDPKGYAIPNRAIHIGYSILHSVISVYMVFGIIGAGKQFLNIQNPVLTYLAQSSYWVYLIHLPIILFIQLKLLDTDWNLWAKFFITLVLATLLSLLSYQLLVRHTPIGWLLNGRIKKAN